MTNNIGAISGGGSGYGVNWNSSSNNNNNVDEQNQQNPGTNANQECKDVNPDEVMAFMARHNNFVELVSPAQVDGVVADPTVADRVAGYMENYEFIMGIIEEEFGTELAPYVMDMVMDRLMGMVD